jgi:hypothetical protein
MSSDIKTIFQTTLTDVSSEDLEGVGTVRHGEAGSMYRWVKNRNATAFTAKQPVCYDATNAGSAALLQAVNSPVTADLMLQAGIAVTAIAASGADCYGWVQTNGYFNGARVLGVSGTAVAIGDELVSANGTTTLTRATAVGTAPKRSLTFIALEAVSADTGATYAKDVYIQCI